MAQIDGVVAHDASAVLSVIDVPTLITFGARDLVCSTRFAEPLKNGIAGSELVVFDHLSHAGLHEERRPSTERRSDFLLRQRVYLGCATSDPAFSRSARHSRGIAVGIGPKPCC